MLVVAYWRYEANNAAWSNSGVAVLLAAYCIFAGTSKDSAGEAIVVDSLASVADILLEVLFELSQTDGLAVLGEFS